MKLFKTVLENLLGSFDVHTKSWSGRKLSGFIGVITGVAITAFNVKADSALYFLISWQVFALMCLGLITAQQLIEFKNKTNEPQNSSKTGSGEGM
jgi:hypothetical protein